MTTLDNVTNGLEDIAIIAVVAGGAFLLWKLSNSGLPERVSDVVDFVKDLPTDPQGAGARLAFSDLGKGQDSIINKINHNIVEPIFDKPPKTPPHEGQGNTTKTAMSVTGEEMQLIMKLSSGMYPTFGFAGIGGSMTRINSNNNPWTWYPSLGAAPGPINLDQLGLDSLNFSSTVNIKGSDWESFQESKNNINKYLAAINYPGAKQRIIDA